MPPVTVEVPPLTVVTSETPTDGPCADGFVLATFTGPTSSGVLILDRGGDVVWAWLVPQQERRVYRARPARDGNGLYVAVGDRVIDNGDVGAILRVGVDGAILSDTPTRDPHHDFVELPDGRLVYLAYEFSQPSDGATQQFLATDRVWALPEGGTVGEVLFTTLGDYPEQARIDTPPEGQDGRSLLGFLDWGHGASLGWRDEDETLFLMWRWLDTLVAIDDQGVRWGWGGDYGELTGSDSFEHAHFSEVWDGGLLVFDNRVDEAGGSRLVEYTFDEASYQKVWEWTEGWWERGVADVRRVPGCDTVMSSWPDQGRIVEVARDGTTTWQVSVEASLERIEPLEVLPF